MAVVPECAGLCRGTEGVRKRATCGATFQNEYVCQSGSENQPGAMGHWLTPAGPSAQLVPFWKMLQRR
jgi:hypothetical protein